MICSIISGSCYIYKHIGENYALYETFNTPLSVGYCWFCCLTILGIGKKYFDKEYQFTKFMSKKSYGIYIFHYLPLSASGYYLHKYSKISPFFQYVIIGVNGFFGSIILFDIIRNIPFLKWTVLGIKDRNNKKEVDVSH